MAGSHSSFRRKKYTPNLNYGRLAKRHKKKTGKLRSISSVRQSTEVEEPFDQPMIIEEPTTPNESGHEALADEEISDYHEEEALEEVHICSDTAVELLATQIQGILSAAGADHHFTKNKEIKPDHYRSMLRRATRFFAYALLKMDWYFTGDAVTIDTILKLIYDDNNHILDYCSEVLAPKVKSSTIKNTTCDILSISKWLHLFCKTKIKKKSVRKWDLYSQVIAAARNIYAAKDAKTKYQNVVSIEERIQSGQFPQNGMQGLQDLANKLIPKALAIVQSSILLKVDLVRGIFKEFMGILLFIFYAFTPQGRACGIVSLREKQIPEIRQKGHVLSNEFKTQKFYHYQPVPLPQQAELLFDQYLAYIRPQAVARSSREPNDPDNYIFLNYDGNRYHNIGQEIANITRDNHLNMTVNDIRALAATQTYLQRRSGNISAKEIDSLNHINGHSSKTVSQFYLSHSFASYVEDGRKLYDSMDALTPADSPFKNPPPPLQWGVKHPQYNLEGKRIEWTKYESDYVGKYVDEHNEHNVYANCLRVITKDPIAVEHFHRHHTENSARLKYGYEKYCKEKSNIVI